VRSKGIDGECESTHEADTCCVALLPRCKEAEALALAPFGRARLPAACPSGRLSLALRSTAARHLAGTRY
jgi:hypothetical protein